MYQSMNILEFQECFGTEKACIDEVYNRRWPEGFICPRCDHHDGTRLSTRPVVQCTSCRRQTSITSGTLFHRLKVPLRNWFWLIFLMSMDKGGISTERAAELLGMHYTTVWEMMHKIRIAMGHRMENLTLSGTVEMDEALFGGYVKRKDGKALDNKKSVCVMVERENRHAGDAALVVLPDQSGEAIQKAVATRLEPMTHIRTDGLSEHSMLHGLVGRLNMDPIKGKYEENGPLENADRVIALAKRYLLGTYHQYCARGYLQRFLNEYSFRFNRRYQWCQLASRLLSACVLCPPILYVAT